MKPVISKKELRDEIERLVEDYIDHGGEVTNVERGVSGRDADRGPMQHLRSFDRRPKETRTPIPEVVAAIERRRQAARKPTTKRKKTEVRRPVKRLVYDEFGEPLRYEWRDE